MKKKLISFAVVLSLALSLTACVRTGAPGNTPPTETTEDERIVGDVPEEFDDLSDINHESRLFLSNGADDNGYWIGVNAADYVEPFDFHGIELPHEVHYVSDEEIRDWINLFIQQLYLPLPPPVHIYDRAVRDGDTLNIDFVGSVNGVEFANGSTRDADTGEFTDGYDVTIGVTPFIDDFLEQLIGYMPGNVIEVNVTFPDNYPQNPDLENQPALFVVPINYIIESPVTDEYVVEHLKGEHGWETYEEFYGHARDVIRRNRVTGFIWEFFSSEVTVNVPDYFMELVVSETIEYLRHEAAGFFERNPPEHDLLLRYFIAYVVNLETGLAGYLELERERDEESARTKLVYQYLYNELELEVSDEELAEYMGRFGDRELSEWISVYGKPYLMQAVMNDAVFDYIFENAVLLEESDEPTEGTE
jgi:trigger factor